MEKFGVHWENHAERIARNWRSNVADEDIVLIPGDVSWAMRLKHALEDLSFIASLPGRYKILVRGNHDYWWETKRKLYANAPPSLVFIHNDAFSVPPFVFAGTRGWELPDPQASEEENAERDRLCRREAERLERSLRAAGESGGRIIALLHFPPCYPERPETPFTEILKKYEPEAVVYGHLHNVSPAQVVRGSRSGTRFYFVSADAVDFTPVLVAEG